MIAGLKSCPTHYLIVKDLEGQLAKVFYTKFRSYCQHALPLALKKNFPLRERIYLFTFRLDVKNEFLEKQKNSNQTH
jgi:hypothetical protein